MTPNALCKTIQYLEDTQGRNNDAMECIYYLLNVLDRASLFVDLHALDQGCESRSSAVDLSDEIDAILYGGK